jgi:hypothetical protein
MMKRLLAILVALGLIAPAAAQTISGGGLWIPSPHIGLVPTVTGTLTYLIDAASEKACLVFQAPKTGNLDRFDTGVTVGNSPDNGLRFSFQSVDATTGQPTGTILGATNNASVTYAHSVTTGWKSTNFTEVAAVTRGDVIAACVEIPSFTASDSVTVTRTAGISRVEGFPYGISTVSTKEGAYLPAIAIHYTDGYVSLGPQTFLGSDTTSNVAFKQDTGTADEWGMAFSLPFAFKLNAVHAFISIAAGANFDLVVYDSDGSTALATISHDGDITQGITGAQYTFFTQSELTLSANTTYRVAFKPSQTSANVTLQYMTFQSAALMSAMEGGSDFYMTSRLDAGGSWTDYNSGTFRRPLMALQITPVSSGGGPAPFF